ncbi:MAG: hypothetical protein K2J99_02060 [Lachnospiraceae bacterium]|nr:hypothetical protein [Lachnospiraceae bacterium]
MMKNRYDADDIHQDVFVRFLKKQPRFDDEEHEKAWFIRVTVNCCTNYHKTAWRRKTVSLSEYERREESECADQGIIMRVEGIWLEENHAEIVVSFGNQEEYHHIKGKVDMYDSYRLVSHEGAGRIGGCFFLTYDELEERAYFRIDMPAAECAADDFTLTGIAYQDGVLRVQMCMGDNTHADRHVQLLRTDAVGNERDNKVGTKTINSFPVVGMET